MEMARSGSEGLGIKCDCEGLIVTPDYFVLKSAGCSVCIIFWIFVEIYTTCNDYTGGLRKSKRDLEKWKTTLSGSHAPLKTTNTGVQKTE